MVPSSLGAMDQVDWVPVDSLSTIILELAGVVPHPAKPDGTDRQPTGIQETGNSLQVYNVTNPRTTSWSSLVPVVNSHFHDKLQVVPWGQWLDTLRQASQDMTSAAARNNPGLKLLDFFESLENDAGSLAPPLAMTRTLTSSPTLRDLQAVDDQWMELWLKQWAF